MDYGFRKPPIAVALGTDGRTNVAYPISSGLYASPLSEPYRRILDTVGSWLTGLPNNFYMARGLHSRVPRIRKKATWVQTTPKRGKETNKKGKKGKGK